MTAVSTLAVLLRARKLVEREETWTAYTSARDASGAGVRFIDPIAVCFCLHGAVRRVAYELTGSDFPQGFDELMVSFDGLAKRRGYPDHLSANDVGGRLVALAVIDDAILELGGTP